MDRRNFIKGVGSIVASSGAIGVPTLSADTYENNLNASKEKALQRIAFGSCNRQGRSQMHWDVISQDNPDLWLWLGDNIYADWSTEDERRKQWNNLKFNPYYDRFRRNTAIMGTWDDHDYGSNNQGKSFEGKAISQQLFADFLDVPHDHPMRLQEGIYHTETFGPQGQQTQVFMLDGRYFKGNPANDGFLGDVQWAWLEAELLASTADLLIISSGIHVTSGITGLGMEGWNSYPAERRRLYDIIERIDAPVLFLSGDRHMAEFVEHKLESGKRIYEFMSSGLTHGFYVPLPHPGRIGKATGRNNYGLINIDWTSQGPQLGLEIKDPDQQGIIDKVQPNFHNGLLG